MAKRKNPQTGEEAKEHEPAPRPSLRYTDSQRQQCINALADADAQGKEIDYTWLARRICMSEDDARAIVAMGYRR